VSIVISPTLAVAQNVPLAPLTTLRVGGLATYYAIVSNHNEVAKAVRFAKQNALPFCVLGGGSNMLVSDDGYSGLVIHVQSQGYVVQELSTTVREITVQAGEMLDSFIGQTVKEGWWGLENLSHIPGTVGATPVQNVGAYGVEVADVISTVQVYDTVTEKEIVLSASECYFGYRDSIFKSEVGRSYIILSVTFRLSTEACPRVDYADVQKIISSHDAPTQSMIREAIISIRSNKFPDWNQIGTAGSFFKNPIVPEAVALALQKKYPELPIYVAQSGYMKVVLGYILDKICHLKGVQVGHVGLYHAQALVLVAEFGATATEVKVFADGVKEKVFAHTNILIEREVTEI